MDIIIKQAKRFSENHYDGGVSDYREIIGGAQEKLLGIDNSLDQIKFINVVLEKNSSEYEEHKKVCRNPEDCDKNFAFENIEYYLTQELNRLGVSFNEDAFTNDEKQDAASKLEKVISDLNDLKLGQEVIYEDLIKEISELKDLYFLGKKKWHQLLIGKTAEMVASGIVSETIAKQIILQ